VAGSSMYPWADWLDGRIWWIQSRVDFFCLIVSIQSQAHLHARKSSVSVATRLVTAQQGEGLLVQAYPPNSTWKPNLINIPVHKLFKTRQNAR